MPRTIDSLSPKQNDAKSKPVAGSIVKPVGAKEPEDRSLRSNSYHADKAVVSMQRKRVNRSRNKLRLLLGIMVTLIAVGGVAWYWSMRENKKAGERTVVTAKESLSQLDAVKGLSDQDKDTFYKQAGAEYAAAQKIGIEPDLNFASDKQALAILSGGRPGAAPTAQALKQLIQNRLEAVKNNGFIQGYVYNFWYGDTAIKWPSTSQVANTGSAQALAEDKRYAAEKAESARQRLQNGSITPEQLLEEITKDRRLRLVDDPNGSNRFAMVRPNQTKIENDTSGNQQYFDLLATMQAPGFSSLLTRSYISAYDTSKTPVEAGYQFVQMTKVVQGEAAVRTYEDYLKQAGGWQW